MALIKSFMSDAFTNGVLEVQMERYVST
eukprot:COSAG01_NODE_69360_length_261_cov_1.277778_1_plen_27_part_01